MQSARSSTGSQVYAHPAARRRRLRRAATCLLAALIAATFGAACQPLPQLHLDAPLHGSFTNASTVVVTGRLVSPGWFQSLTINGTPVAIEEDFSHPVAVSAALVFNRIVLEGTLVDGGIMRRTALVIVGDGVNSGFVLDGDFTDDGVGLRFADTGLEQISPIIEGMSAGALDLATLITAQNPIAQGSMSGVNYIANVVEVGFGAFGLDVDPSPSGVDTTITIDDFFLEIDLDLGWLGACTLEVDTATTTIGGSFDMGPSPIDPTYADVNLVSPVGVTLGGFSSQFVSGICDDPLIGDIIGLIINQGDIQQLMQDGFEQNLADPDGAGPDDSVLADAIEDALAGISIAGPIGAALGGVVDAPIASISEDGNGLTILADASIYSDSPAPGAPDLPASYTVNGAAPVFPSLTPNLQLPYGMAFAISTSAMNQLIKTQIENGLLATSFHELLGAPVTAGLLTFVIPEMAGLPAATPIEIRLQPTVAPVFTGNPGPGGEFAELKIGGLGVQLIVVDNDFPILEMEIELDAGIDLAFTTAGLEFVLATGTTPNIAITIVSNPLGSDEASLISTFQLLFPLMAPSLEDAIEAFPIPSFLGLDLEPIEVAQLSGGAIGLFANLATTPTTSIQNVVFNDASSGDFREQGGCWLREWRHRLSGNALGNTISANMRGMLGADAGCTTNDASSSATIDYTVDFDVVSVPGEQWTVRVDHSLLGALGRISDGYNDGIGFQDGGGTATLQSNVEADYTATAIGSGSFDAAPNTSSISDGIGGSSSNQNVGFSASNFVEIVGTGDSQISLRFTLDLDAFSNSNTAFPTANGDEMAIRLGKNDTIDNNFTAGGYPGMGNRNIADDGHKMSVTLTSVPLP